MCARASIGFHIMNLLHLLSAVVEVLFVGLHPVVELNKLRVSAAVLAANVRMFNDTIRCLIIYPKLPSLHNSVSVL